MKEKENAFDSIRVNAESLSNEIDESDVQSEQQDEQRIWTCRGTTILFELP
jgi:hypothetical protein